MASSSEILDACALINLYASKFMSEIISSRPAQCYVVEQVLQESLFIRRPSDTGVGFDKEPLALTSLFDSDQIRTVELQSEEEKGSFVNFALQIDDGEAATIAIAISRQMQVVTDDKKTIRLLKRETPGTACFSTLEVIKTWSEECLVGFDATKAALSNVLKYANYRPGKGHPLFEWWHTILNS